MARQKRDEEEIQATAAELPLEPPEEIVEELKKQCKDGLMIYKASSWTDPLTDIKEKTVRIHCSVCGHEQEVDRYEYIPGCSSGYTTDKFGFHDPTDHSVKFSGNVCICPNCGIGVEVIHVSRIKDTHIFDSADCMTSHNVRGHLVLLSWKMFKECNKEGVTSYTIKRREGIGVVGGYPVRFTGFIRYYYGTTWLNRWEARQVFRDNVESWKPSELYIQKETIEQTEAANCAIYEYIKDLTKKDIEVAAYIKLWTKYPQIENLVRCGYSQYLYHLLESCMTCDGWHYSQRYNFSTRKVKEYIDVKKVKPHEMLGVEKQDLYLAKKLTPDILKYYVKVWNERRIRLTEEMLQYLGHRYRDFDRLIEVFKVPMQKTLNYLMRQAKKSERSIVSISPDYLRDYWNMLKEVYNNTIPKELMWPKNLRKAHDDIQTMIKAKEDKEISDKIVQFAIEMSKFTFEDPETGLFIRPIANQTELIAEGKSLHHCVGTYAKKYAARSCCIFAIRRIKSPNRPYFTLEYDKGKVLQNRGNKNCERTKAVVAFEEKWLKFIKSKEIKNNAGNSRIKKQCAGA